MYRLLIVDDEEIITDGLYEVFSRLMPDRLDVCKAYSGKEALNWMSNTRIDIVLTDIAMPGMNGLELIEEIHAYWPRCKAIFLTGHSNFEYTYKAIQMPNVRYLLKTEGYDKVTETVIEVMEEIQRRQLDNLLLEQSREQIYAYEMMAQGDYLRHLLQKSNAVCADQEVLQREFNKLNISLDPTSGVMMVLAHLDYQKGKTYTERSEILSAVRAIWEDHFSEQIHCNGIVDKHGDILFFIQPISSTKNEKMDNHFNKYLEGTLELVQEECLSSIDITVGFTISGGFNKWGSVTKMYEHLRQLQQLKIGEDIPVILRASEEQNNEYTSNKGLESSQIVEILVVHLEANRSEEFFIVLKELEQSLQNGCIQQMIETYFSVAIVLYSYINRMGWSNRIDHSEKLLRLDDHASMKSGFRYLNDIATEVFKVKQTDERDRASKVIERICQYIENNLSEDLSLVRLAEIHYFNPSYLSHFFKQEYGINLSEYIDKCRIRKAKKLLRDGNVKIREVGMEVGYNAAHSFTRFFKKVTGLTPKEFRDNYTLN
ncbi:response regulator [Halalkalibacter sp. APA_J-10(15)]|uniref:response regulator transcription factor n=1 Tax=Halalkalibacter sp. APA_J-10(15) TaxID=2933805 RepID=UPI001FF1071A|nr:response regulator [Halalkalibacter sp. APA_J-10(15)]MCK0470986.1 response regulator [Halalkalibacter sp. APA_J-10(15)]